MLDASAMVAGATKLADVVGKLGVLDAVKAKLAQQPDLAATKLAAALAEIEKTILAFESEVTAFLAINLSPGPDYRKDMSILYSLESNALWARTNSARGHCAKIGNIYDTYLDPWFQKVTGLKKSDRDALRTLFMELRHTDNAMMGLLNSATAWLGEAAKEVLERLEDGKLEDANMLIAKSRKDVLPVRRSLSSARIKLGDLQAEFIGMSGVA